MRNGSRKIPSGKSPPGRFLPIKVPLENRPRKTPTQNFLTHFIGCLSSLKSSFRQMFTNIRIKKTKSSGLEELKMLFRVVEEGI